MSSRVKWGGSFIAVAAVVAAIIAGGGPEPPPSPTSMANLWVDTTTSGNTCSRTSGSGVDYTSNVACNSFDAAWDAASAGDTIRVKNGDYPIQDITGDKGSETFIIGESKAGVVVSGTAEDCSQHIQFGASTIFCADGNRMTLRDVTLDAGSEDGSAPGSKIAANNVTYENVDILGDYPDISVGDISAPSACSPSDCGANFTWDGGVYGDVNPPKRGCGADPGSNGEPVWIYSPGVTLNGVTFNKQWGEVEITSGGTCADDDNPHLEFVRLEEAANNFTWSNNRYLPGSDAGSGYLFASVNVTGLKIIGNYFADNAGISWMQAGSITPSIIAYNTFSGDDGVSMAGTSTWVGNYGPQAQGGCGSHKIKNVWGGTSGACGTDTFVGGTSLGVTAATGAISAGAPAVDAAETPGASDYCTNPAFVNSIDFDGDTRPFGSVCDAGADEYTE